MHSPLKIGDLVAKIPLIQGGMGVGISLSGLAGAVALEGGIGIISTAQIGFLEEDYDENPLKANLRAIGKHIKRAKEIARGGIVGVNIMVATMHYDQYVSAAVEAGADLIISGAGLPIELPKLTKGSNVKILPIVSSVKSANVILKMWDRKDNIVPDGIVIEGPLAGGHLGFKREELDNIDNIDYNEEIKGIMETVAVYENKYNKKIPVIVAGGISDKSKMEQCFELGADGVQIASRFVPTKECDADIKYKEAYINCKKDDIVIVKSPVGMPGRAIKNKFLDVIANGERIPSKKCRGCIISCKPASTPYCISDALINAAIGNVDNGLLFCGADAYKVEKITTVKQVINEFF